MVGCGRGTGVGAAGEMWAVHGEASRFEVSGEDCIVGWGMPGAVNKDDSRFGGGHC